VANYALWPNQGWKQVQDEKRLLIEKVEELVSEFRDRYSELALSLPDFLHQVWKQRMKEILREKELMGEDEIQSLRRTGILLELERRRENVLCG
jgi:hypothetical protein